MDRFLNAVVQPNVASAMCEEGDAGWGEDDRVAIEGIAKVANMKII